MYTTSGELDHHAAEELRTKVTEIISRQTVFKHIY